MHGASLLGAGDAFASARVNSEMSAQGVNKYRRRVLVATTSLVGAVGAGFVAVPFISSMNPSAQARAAGAPVEADISQLEPGALLRVKWRGKPVWIVHRTPEMLAALPTTTRVSSIRAPRSPSSRSTARTRRAPSSRSTWSPSASAPTWAAPRPTAPRWLRTTWVPDWKGGWFCPCHGSRFDLAARVFKGVPAPTNLVIPPHMYLNDTTILVGQDQGAA